MMPQKVYADPRKYLRFKAMDDTYVLLKTQKGENTGFLLDISSGGLSFEYIPVETIAEKNCQLYIIQTERNIRIEIPSCDKIFEYEIEDKYYTPVKMHRVGVQFSEIEPRILDELASLICPDQNLI